MSQQTPSFKSAYMAHPRKGWRRAFHRFPILLWLLGFAPLTQ